MNSHWRFALKDDASRRERALRLALEVALRSERHPPDGFERTLHRMANAVTAATLHVGVLEADAGEMINPEELRESVAQIKEDIRRIRRYLEELQERPAEGESSSLTALLDRVLADHPQVQWQRPDGDVRIAHAALLEGALRHLVENAFEGNGTRAATVVRLELIWQEPWIKVCVHDNGPGISDGVLADVGRPFRTTKDGRLGLGLFTCQRVAALCDGSFTLKPRAEGGSTAELLLHVPKAPENLLTGRSRG